ncbi:MAG: hypothetical protein VB089_10100 [Anaerolineaceae bacterium]|jgi:hypothetical protein|nr:hypothetical protein [Anaerolineaceae bacterium]
MTIQQIIVDGLLLAILIPRDHNEDGLHFVTPDDFPQQMAYMHHPAGKLIQPHMHCNQPKQIYVTQEVLVLKRGRLRVDFYDADQNYLLSRVVEAGDIILLAYGGHGFCVLDEVEMIEIKQGPYEGVESDKIKFEPTHNGEIVIET